MIVQKSKYVYFNRYMCLATSPAIQHCPIVHVLEAQDEEEAEEVFWAIIEMRMYDYDEDSWMIDDSWLEVYIDEMTPEQVGAWQGLMNEMMMQDTKQPALFNRDDYKDYTYLPSDWNPMYNWGFPYEKYTLPNA